MSRVSRFLRLALLAGGVGQLPGLLLLASITSPLIALGLVTLLSLPFYLRIRKGPEGDVDGVRGLALLAFYAWWGGSMMAGILYLPALAIAALVHAPARAAATVALGAGVLVGLLGVTRNRRPRLRRVRVDVPGLDPSLDGLRIAHLSDLHMGGHTPPSRVRRWVDRVNALAVDLVAVTGDLITVGDAHVDHVGEELSRLRARDGVALCLGNHDYFGSVERLVRGLRRGGTWVLRNEGRVIEREGGGRYYLAGVDDTWTRRADIARTMAARPEASLASIVLAHDPSCFPELADRGATLVLSGHTHGGQIAFPLFSRALNLARVYYRCTAGLYRRGESSLYVTLGIGETGPALRIGSPSEIALITLHAA